MGAAAPSLSGHPEIRPTPLAALADPEMPTERHFVRNHFHIPQADAAAWTLAIDGAVERPLSFSLDDLLRMPARTQAVTLECAGHRRAEFEPATSGVQWGAGAVSEARWTGVPLEDLLNRTGVTAGATEVVFEGADCGKHRTSDGEVPFARSIPLARALNDDVLVAFEMNGSAIPAVHGAPIRAIVPGVYAVASVKWLRRIEVLERPFDGPFQVDDYRMFGLGSYETPESVQDLNINALIVAPETGAVIRGGSISISGIAWGGRGGVDAVEVRLSGQQWRQAFVAAPNPPYGLVRWRCLADDVPPGEHTIEVRARDRTGRVQPEKPQWNTLGYANNSKHRVAITVRAP